jgi:AcrR family transcriptional regulator
MASIAPLEWVRPPQQARSHRTLERILDAAEELFGQRGFEGTTVAEIARAAQSSVGALYARFADKEALLRCVFERIFQQGVATVEEVTRPQRWVAVPTSDMLHMALRFLVQVYRERRRLLTAFASTPIPEIHSYSSRMGEVITNQVVALFQYRSEVGTVADLPRAVGFCVWMILASLQARALHDFEDGPPLSDDEIAAEATQMFMSYLGMSYPATGDLKG